MATTLRNIEVAITVTTNKGQRTVTVELGDEDSDETTSEFALRVARAILELSEVS